MKTMRTLETQFDTYFWNSVVDIFLDLKKAFDTVAHQILC